MSSFVHYLVMEIFVVAWYAVDEDGTIHSYMDLGFRV